MFWVLAVQISACHPGAVNATAAPSAMQRRYAAAYRWVVALSGVYVAAVLLLLAAASTQEIALQPTSITSNGGHAYVVAVPHRAFPYEVHSDDINDGLRSRLRLYEDGVQLGPAHTAHVSIRDHGHGTFSHWSGSLVFSSSDNTDPRTNGRRYTAAVPRASPLLCFGRLCRSRCRRCFELARRLARFAKAFGPGSGKAALSRPFVARQCRSSFRWRWPCLHQ